jgi:cytochrome P450
MSEELFQAEEGRGNDPATRARLNSELYAYARGLVHERIARPLDPEVDLISGFLAQTDGTHTVTEETCVELIRLLLTAGHNSTTGGIGNSIMRVAVDPGVQHRLRAEPELIPGAVEEFLRLEAPVQSMPRWANEDVTLHGRTISRGEAIMLHWAAANRDPDHFREPDRCLIDRSPNDHLTFGRGIHRCIGIDLARLEIRVALEELLDRTSWFELAGAPVRTTYIRQGVSHLPLKLVPTKEAGS